MFPQRKACEKESSLRLQSKDIFLDNQNNLQSSDYETDVLMAIGKTRFTTIADGK